MFSRKTADLLIEVGTEEFPPTSLKDLMLAFGASVRRRHSDQVPSRTSQVPCVFGVAWTG